MAPCISADPHANNPRVLSLRLARMRRRQLRNIIERARRRIILRETEYVQDLMERYRRLIRLRFQLLAQRMQRRRLFSSESSGAEEEPNAAIPPAANEGEAVEEHPQENDVDSTTEMLNEMDVSDRRPE